MPHEPTTQIVHADSALAVSDLPEPTHGLHPAENRLDGRRLKALELMMVGASAKSICEKVGINRTTLWRWRNTDSRFMSALNLWRSQVHSTINSRVQKIAELATVALMSGLRGGDGQLGFRVLEKLGGLRPGPLDQKERPEALDDPAALRRYPKAGQFERSAQLLAMGAAADNQRTGRRSPRELVELAGLAPEETIVTIGPMLACPPRSDANDARPSPGESGAAPPPQQVKSRVVGWYRKFRGGGRGK